MLCMADSINRLYLPLQQKRKKKEEKKQKKNLYKRKKKAVKKNTHKKKNPCFPNLHEILYHMMCLAFEA